MYSKHIEGKSVGVGGVLAVSSELILALLGIWVVVLLVLEVCSGPGAGLESHVRRGFSAGCSGGP